MSLTIITQGGTGGESASIFITGLTSGSTVTAKKGSKTINGVWNSSKSRYEISSIKEYGTWIVTATNGMDVKEQDVLVDVAMDYTIHMRYNEYLYYRGNNIYDFYQSYYQGSKGSITFNSDHVEIYGYYPDAGAQTVISLRTRNKVDITNYSKLKFKVDSITGGPWFVGFGLGTASPIDDNEVSGAYVRTNDINFTSGILTLDISSVTGSYYVEASLNTGRNVTAYVKISEIWLEY